MTTNDLDKFKRRLIRSVARMLHDKVPYDTLWANMTDTTGCDCEILWQRMRALTIKKLSRLLAVEDYTKRVMRVARMTVTDWLMYDLVLVHEPIDVIGISELKDELPEQLSDLLNLIRKYNVEDRHPDTLLEAWMQVTDSYNQNGRQCSIMLLQRRWYQLKEYTRKVFYSFWNTNYNNFDKAVQKPKKICIDVAKLFPKIIITYFTDWEELKKKKMIVLPDQVNQKLKEGDTREKSTVSSSTADVLIVEPHIETIDLGQDSDSEDPNASLTDGVIKQQEVPNYLNNILSSADESIIDYQSIANKVTNDITTDNQDIDNTKLSSVTEPNLIASVCNEFTENTPLHPEVDGLSNVKIIETTHILQQIEPNHNTSPGCKLILKEKEGIDEIGNNLKNGKDNTLNIKDESSNAIGDMPDERNNKELNSNSSETIPVICLSDLDIVDDGIEFGEFDDDITVGIENADMISNECETIDSVNESPIKEQTFDLKLIMTPIVYTTKIDEMPVLKDKGKDKFIQVNAVIDDIIKESKPKYKDLMGLKKITNDCKNDDSFLNSDKFDRTETEDIIKLSSSEEPTERIKMGSYLFQKPKTRTYNPILLCKNPDFNTRLKRLSVGFMMLPRNRQLLKACKPMTIDLHKAFERKISDGRLYLKHVDEVTANQQPKSANVDSEPASVAPSAMLAQSLIDNVVVNIDDLIPEKSFNEIVVQETQPLHVEEHIEQPTLPASTQEDIPKLCENQLSTEIPNVFTQSMNHPLLGDSELMDIDIAKKHPRTLKGYVKFTKAGEVKLGSKGHIKYNYCNSVQTPWFIRRRAPLMEDLLTISSLNKMLRYLCLDNNINLVVKENPLQNQIFSMKDPDSLLTKNTTKIQQLSSQPSQFATTSTSDVSAQSQVAKTSTSDASVQQVNPLAINDAEEKVKPRKQRKPKYCCWVKEKDVKLEAKCKGLMTRIKLPKHTCFNIGTTCTCCCKIEFNDNIYQSNKTYSRIKAKHKVKQAINKTNIINKNSSHFSEQQINSSVTTNIGATKTPQYLIKYNISEINGSAEKGCNLVSQNNSECIVLSDDEPISDRDLVKSTPDVDNNSIESNSAIVIQSSHGKISIDATAGSAQQHDIKLLNVEKSMYNTIIKNDKKLYIVRPRNFKKQPIRLGKNKILLTTAHIDKTSSGEINKTNTIPIIPAYPLPPGVQLILLPNNQVSVVIPQNVELSEDDLGKVTHVVDIIQKQLEESRIIPMQLPAFNLSDVTVLSNDETLLENKMKEDDNNKKLVNCNNVVPPIENVVSDTVTETHFKITDNSEKLDNNKLEASISSNNTETTSIPNQTDNSNDVIMSVGNEQFDSEEQHILQSIPEVNIINTEEMSPRPVLKIKNVASINESVSCEIGNDNNSNVGKKSILSDLMQMSGISTEDTKLQENIYRQLNFQSISTLESNIELGLEIQSKVVELTPVISLEELKMATEQKGRFFSLNFDTEKIVPVKIDVRKKIGIPPIKISESNQLPTNNIIELDDENGEREIITPRNDRSQNNTIISVIYKRYKDKQKSLLENTTSRKYGNVYRRKQSLLRPASNCTVEQIEVIDSDEEPMVKEHREDSVDNISENIEVNRKRRLSSDTNIATAISDIDSSDDEPLAKKITRRKKLSSLAPEIENDTRSQTNNGKDNGSNTDNSNKDKIETVVNCDNHIEPNKSTDIEESPLNNKECSLDVSILGM